MKDEIQKALKDFKKAGPVAHLLAALKDRLAGRMTQDELQENCYRWSFQYALEDLKCKLIPSKPQFYLGYLMKSEKIREKIWKEHSRLRDMIMGYLSEIKGIQIQNDANESWIREMVKFFDKKAETLKVEKLMELQGGYRNG